MKVSIITVCYNSAEYIDSAIQSVINQSYSNLEYIIIDGCSSDNTVAIIKSYGKNISLFISEPDLGIYDAMNKGLRFATGDVIGLLNSDDFYYSEDVISQIVNAFCENPGSEIVVGNVDYFTPPNLVTPVRKFSIQSFASWKMRFGFSVAHPASFVKRSAYNKVGGYDKNYKIGADFDWFLRALINHRIYYKKLDQTLVGMREGGVSTSGRTSYSTSSKELLNALRVNHVYSNSFLVFIRLPVKFLQKLFFNLKQKFYLSI